MRGVKKAHLPEKPCLACGRPFAWRRKWEKVWDEVKYCSDACRRFKATGGKPPAQGDRASEEKAMNPQVPARARRPLHLTLVGATGRLGGHVLAAALARGHHLTVLVRQPAGQLALPLAVRVVTGDVCDPAAVAAALVEAEVVISCLGTRRGQEPLAMLERGMATMVAAAAARGQLHLLAVASAGLLDAPEGGLRRDRAGYPPAFKAGSAAHLAAFQVLAASKLPWTLVCPPELVEGAADQPLQWQRDRLPPGPLRVSMPALAAWMLDEAEEPTQLGQRVGLTDLPPAKA